jgi:ribosomal-protein-serine acetyltransferase
VGVIGHHGIDRRIRATELGHWLAANAQGRGVMTRSCRALVKHAFEELGLNRVVIRCATENLRSRAIPLRLGFRHEGVLRDAEWLYDHYVDDDVFAMLARDWKAP